MVKTHCFDTAYAIKEYSTTRHLWDTPLFESESFVAVPTVGALVEGWLLVVPKVHALAFAHLPESLFGELESFVSKVVINLQSHYGSVSLFEHGPATVGSTVGCGVDYAHLHLVPTACDLQSGAKLIAPEIHWSCLESLKAIRRCASAANGYWLLQEPYGTGRIHVGQCAGKQPSQLFRKVIANHIGSSASFDWKTALGEELISATVETLSEDLVVI